jgi:hypothetical protein
MRRPSGRYGFAGNHRPQVSHWVTFDLLRSLSRLDGTTDWLSLEPRTPFRAYPKRERRFLAPERVMHSCVAVFRGLWSTKNSDVSAESSV